MEDKKLQWSKFSPDRTEQYVIRSDDEEEFDRLVKKYKGELPTTKAFPDDEGQYAHSEEQTQSKVPLCKVHNKPMRAGKYGFFCATKLDDGSWCKYKA